MASDRDTPRTSARSVMIHRLEAVTQRYGITVAPGTVRDGSGATDTLVSIESLAGFVVARRELLRTLPGSASDPHAVDTAVLRLRKALGDSKIVATVVKRGYRLAVDENVDAALI